MAKVIRRTWVSEAGSGLARTDRLSCGYEAYVPDALVGRSFGLDGPVAAGVAEAEAAIARLDVEAAALIDTEALARLLLRAESVASSRIEGLEIGARRLLRAEADRGARWAESRVPPPLSLVLATWADDYIRALDGTRFLGAPTSQEAHEGINRLIGLVAAPPVVGPWPMPPPSSNGSPHYRRRGANSWGV
jgi:hypothetical protein